MNHHWHPIKQDSTHLQQCKRCGVIRKKITIKTLMAIIQEPPYDCYKYKSAWIYFVDGEKTYDRPDCNSKIWNID
jgi:hypothetical protein